MSTALSVSAPVSVSTDTAPFTLEEAQAPLSPSELKETALRLIDGLDNEQGSQGYSLDSNAAALSTVQAIRETFLPQLAPEDAAAITQRIVKLLTSRYVIIEKNNKDDVKYLQQQAEFCQAGEKFGVNIIAKIPQLIAEKYRKEIVLGSMWKLSREAKENDYVTLKNDITAACAIYGIDVKEVIEYVAVSRFTWMSGNISHGFVGEGRDAINGGFKKMCTALGVQPKNIPGIQKALPKFGEVLAYAWEKGDIEAAGNVMNNLRYLGLINTETLEAIAKVAVSKIKIGNTKVIALQNAIAAQMEFAPQIVQALYAGQLTQPNTREYHDLTANRMTQPMAAKHPEAMLDRKTAMIEALRYMSLDMMHNATSLGHIAADHDFQYGSLNRQPSNPIDAIRHSAAAQRAKPNYYEGGDAEMRIENRYEYCQTLKAYLPEFSRLAAEAGMNQEEMAAIEHAIASFAKDALYFYSVNKDTSPRNKDIWERAASFRNKYTLEGVKELAKLIGVSEITLLEKTFGSHTSGVNEDRGQMSALMQKHGVNVTRVRQYDLQGCEDTLKTGFLARGISKVKYSLSRIAEDNENVSPDVIMRTLEQFVETLESEGVSYIAKIGKADFAHGNSESDTYEALEGLRVQIGSFAGRNKADDIGNSAAELQARITNLMEGLYNTLLRSGTNMYTLRNVIGRRAKLTADIEEAVS